MDSIFFCMMEFNDRLLLLDVILPDCCLQKGEKKRYWWEDSALLQYHQHLPHLEQEQ